MTDNDDGKTRTASSSDLGKTKVDNPSAFPSIETHPSFDMPMHHFGMSLRDWFAGQCLASSPSPPFGDRDCLPRARRCYEMADAMLEARAVQP